MNVRGGAHLVGILTATSGRQKRFFGQPVGNLRWYFLIARLLGVLQCWDGPGRLAIFVCHTSAFALPGGVSMWPAADLEPLAQTCRIGVCFGFCSSHERG